MNNTRGAFLVFILAFCCVMSNLLQFRNTILRRETNDTVLTTHDNYTASDGAINSQSPVSTSYTLQTKATMFQDLDLVLPKHPSLTSWSPNPTTKFDLLLNVPFYVYEEALLSNLTYNLSNSYYNFKHATDILFARAALSHPMRTLDPSHAKLFVVPTFINLISEHIAFLKSTICAHVPMLSPVRRDSNEHNNSHQESMANFMTTAPTNEATNATMKVNNTISSDPPEMVKLCNMELIWYADEFLAGSTWFRRHGGRDHMLVYSHYYKLPVTNQTMNLRSCNHITFEAYKRNNPDRHSFSDLYVGKRCIPVTDASQKKYDFAMIAGFKPIPTHQSRRDICLWMEEIQKNNRTNNYTMPVCGWGQQCPALAQSRFGFHSRGDTFGSNRLMDTLLSHTVPIFTITGQYAILPNWIDWKQVSVYAPVTNKSVFLSAIQEIAANESLYQTLYRNVVANSNLFDWTTLVPFDMYMYMLSCKLWPELAHNAAVESQYSAFILPRS